MDFVEYRTERDKQNACVSTERLYAHRLLTPKIARLTASSAGRHHPASAESLAKIKPPNPKYSHCGMCVTFPPSSTRKILS